MFKTIRRGEASLQYTILPQNGQIRVNEMSSACNLESSAFSPGKSSLKGECRPFDEPWYPKTVKRRHFGFRTIAIFLCVCMTSYFLVQFASVIFCNEYSCQSASLITNEIFVTEKHAEAISSKINSITNSLRDSNFSETFDNNAGAANVMARSIFVPTTHTKELEHSETTIDEITSLESQSTTSLPIIRDDTFILPEDSSHTRSNSIVAAPKKPLNILQKWKMLKIPRVTLKLRENETIPQMYMKSGIASYKKGNVTTSVLAKQLSLEGLIFKTPEGTIKPWHEELQSKNQLKVTERSALHVHQTVTGALAGALREDDNRNLSILSDVDVRKMAVPPEFVIRVLFVFGTGMRLGVQCQHFIDNK